MNSPVEGFQVAVYPGGIWKLLKSGTPGDDVGGTGVPVELWPACWCDGSSFVSSLEEAGECFSWGREAEKGVDGP